LQDQPDVFHNLTAVFQQVFHIEWTSDIPTILGENEVFQFEEQHDSELVKRGKRNTDGWLMFESAVDTAVIANPKRDHPVIRHFLLTSSFLGCQWLCTDYEWELLPVSSAG
jgi:hypothetical protein